ncbi:hypothetical protein DFR24_3117 [Panacagrimonas perspica]|uniref:Dicarboxylate transport n=1 Tax=Panacagrimonas perspica TaxID=381431 RepID=A0A4S3JYA8_9GAMM|nr:hypothetical protein [Panacagrimonas perspica]TDU28742.1 hypothetical protein DFR24_3117 [Panacagrimonas perspica]THD00552.1 hypothetical protein B1810_24345 [Panacagrimonas perspica]
MFRIALALFLFACSGHAAALRVQLDVGSIEHPALPAPLTKLHFDCALVTSAKVLSCADGTLRAAVQDQTVEVKFDGRLQRNGDWQAKAKAKARAMTLSELTGRYATDKLDFDLSAQIIAKAGHIDGKAQAALPRGQIYIEPVFVDFGAAPATLEATWKFGIAGGRLDVPQFEIVQNGVMHIAGRATKVMTPRPEIELQIEDLLLAPVFTTYAQPFLASSRLEKLSLSGRAHGSVSLIAASPTRIALQLEGAGLESESFSTGLSGLDGSLAWQSQGEGAESRLHWTSGHVADLKLGAAELRFRTSVRDVTLLAPLRIPLAGGALNIRQLAVQRAGQADMAALFDAEIEPLDLPTLTRAFGWPEFGGQLGGRLPGLSLKDGELTLSGALTARAFDGEVTVDGLRVLDAFGRVPRVEADIRLRDLDLAAVTGAFSFGRIEGRLDGDVQDLRLLNWQPISFKARLATPKDDESRHRISQRAIDNISSIGGGPTGVLSRGALRFFKDFVYDRIGWSCVLAKGVCTMDGIEKARNGGYVLVKGRLVPRIDVVGYSRQVDWNTFIAQLKDARNTDNIQVR